MSQHERPDPEALLKQLQVERAEAGGKGRLKVYLGMAAGVGKTYSMLADAQALKARGVDVVVGYLEPHGRRETEDLAEGLERLPLREIPHSGVVLTEFDTDAALQRKPELLLLDELAHTNAPGSRHAKRWQDAEELLRAGIDVYATVNVQHLESLNDVVAQITGIRVAETLPDSIIADAAEVELVDLPPEELIQRIREGKVYIPEKIEQALGGFFKKKHLTALRELALRKTAESVDRQVQVFREIEGAREPWHTTERILVCVAPNRMATRVVRAARRMADALHGEVLAVTVESPRQAKLGAEGRHLAYEGLRLAENLGAQTTVLSGDDIVKTVMEFARSKNVTTLIVGKPVRPKWKELLFGSFVDSMVRSSGDIDVHVITGPEETGTRLALTPAKQATDWRGWLFALAATGATTGLNAVLDPYLGDAGKVSLYLLGVAIVASRSSQSASFLASLLSVASFNFFFTEPRATFTVNDPQYWVVFLVMLVVGLMISVLTSRHKEQSQSESERAKRTSALYDLSRKLSSTRSRKELGAFAAEQIRNVFGCDVAVLVRSRKTSALFAAPPSRTGFESQPKEQAVAKWVVDHGKRAGKGTDTLPGSDGLYLPLTGGRGPVGVLGVRWDGGPEWDIGQLHLLETFANQLAVAIERTNLAKDSHESAIEAESERLRSTLLSSVSHDFRTPLAVISGAAEQLSERLEPGRDHELAESIAAEASRLERQVRNLLDMTRVRAGALKVTKEWQSIEELVGAALSRTDLLLAGHTIHVELPPDLPLLELDGVLVEQVFVNLFENAARHTPPGTNVWIKAWASNEAMRIEVANDGPSLEPGELATIFEKFSQGSQAHGGSGLGLAICRAIVEAHGGEITAVPAHPQGVRFIVSLPASRTAPEVPIG
ncbi:MAG: sensor histidine kinase KdpD [Fimbriimonadaceae bacterium]|nr:sensor histidine kinase KdpD [Fimbriimonadaceae bacterium]QYK56708.1 MAG: sensor histidine kinase KdpD [Fimbriimonadaceae bacterium]